MKVKKIMCFCGSGLGTSFLMEINVKKVLNSMGLGTIEVVHATVEDVKPGAADLFVCGIDLAPNAEKAGRVLPLKNIVSYSELQEKMEEILKEE